MTKMGCEGEGLCAGGGGLKAGRGGLEHVLCKRNTAQMLDSRRSRTKVGAGAICAVHRSATGPVTVDE
jgi:hypothetical protein